MVGNFLLDGRGSPAVGEGLAPRLRERGWEVEITSRQPGKLARLWDMLAMTHRLRNWTDVAQVDLFSGSAFRWAEAVTWLLARQGTPLVLTLHGGGLPEFARRHPTRVRRVLERARTITSPSTYLQKGLEFLGVPITVLPNPVDLAALRFRRREVLRPRLIWLRALHSIYNPLMAIRTLAAVREVHPETCLWMVGPDKGDGSLADCRALAAELGLVEGEAVHFVGAVPKQDVPRWLDQADVFLNTTTVDNTPVSVLEALAQGCCVVSTDVGGIPHLLVDGITGRLVPSGDHGAMASAVLQLLDDPAAAEAISVAGRQFAQRCDYPLVLDAWERCLAAAQTREAGEGS